MVNVDRTRKFAGWLLAAAVVSLGCTLLRNAGVTSPLWPRVWDKAYNLAEFVAVAACALRATRSAGAERAAWALLALGLFGYAAADVYYTVVLEPLASPPFPSLADVGYLSIYPSAYAALLLLLRARAGRAPRQLWLDGVVCALAVAAGGAALVFDVVAGTDGPLATVATNLAYPLGDLAMLAFVITVVTVTGRAGATWLLIALGFGVWAVADTLYLAQTALGTYREYTLLDTAWPASAVLIAFAAWAPAHRLDPRRLRSGMLALPAAATLFAVGLLVFDHYSELNDLALWLACASVGTAVIRFALTFRENLRMLADSELDATTDELTGLRNRRALLHDLDAACAAARSGHPALLALFDLDGFKAYNDTFGHVAGDALLGRLGRSLAAGLAGEAVAYRMGGDEFCLLTLAPPAAPDEVAARAARALSESGERFTVGCSYGAVLLPADGTEPADALRLADQRMYAAKRRGRRSVDESVHQVLLRVVAERDGALHSHVDDVARLAVKVGIELGLDPAHLIDLRRAATLHDIGKIAIPDAILDAPRALDAREWEYMRQHTIIGARIISVAPELAEVARIVRSSHEHVDGAGYPDGLAGDEIPLGARIIAACDAYDAMTTTRVYRDALPAHEALAELERCAGSQFDPRVVAALTALLRAAADRDRIPSARPARVTARA